MHVRSVSTPPRCTACAPPCLELVGKTPGVKIDSVVVSYLRPSKQVYGNPALSCVTADELTSAASVSVLRTAPKTTCSILACLTSDSTMKCPMKPPPSPPPNPSTPPSAPPSAPPPSAPPLAPPPSTPPLPPAEPPACPGPYTVTTAALMAAVNECTWVLGFVAVRSYSPAQRTPLLGRS